MNLSQPASNSEPPLVDFQRLEEVCMADPDSMIELAEFFFSQADEEMVALEQAISNGAAEIVRRLAHRLLGASAGCGMTRLVPPITQLEQEASQGDLSKAGELFTLVATLLHQTRAEIQKWQSALQR
jgi:HPt (histidine-containing phosphotransfer) domain-containing protein